MEGKKPEAGITSVQLGPPFPAQKSALLPMSNIYISANVQDIQPGRHFSVKRTAAKLR
jgi:hypothetical protein